MDASNLKDDHASLLGLNALNEGMRILEAAIGRSLHHFRWDADPPKLDICRISHEQDRGVLGCSYQKGDEERETDCSMSSQICMRKAPPFTELYQSTCQGEEARVPMPFGMLAVAAST